MSHPRVMIGFVLALALVALDAPTAPARADVYVGSTQSGQTVRLVTSGKRIGEMTFGSLATRCGRFDAFADAFVPLRRGGRFRAFDEVPSGSEFVTVHGRVVKGRAEGTVATTSPDDCHDTTESWSAKRVRPTTISGHLLAGPTLAGARAVWGERRGPRLLVRVGDGGPASTLFQTRAGGARVTGLQASAFGVAFSLGASQYFGPLGGPLSRMRGCRQPSPAIDGSLVLYQVSRPCGADSELRLRDLSTGADTLVERLRSPAALLRLAGRFAAVAVANRIDVLDRASGNTLISVPRPRLGDFDIQSDGKLALSRLPRKALCARCLQVVWYSPPEPTGHVAGVPWLVAPHVLWIEHDRIGYVERDRSVTSLRVDRLSETGARLASFVRSSLVGRIAFDGAHVAFAERSARGPVRVEVLPVAP